MTEDMRLYYNYTISPLGRLYYQTVWRQLGELENKKILDFGSGFGFNSNRFAEKNDVTSVEYYQEMIDASEKKHPFKQLKGDVSVLKNFEVETFDVIILHLVLEFVEQPKDILSGLIPLLKSDGFISIVRHNRAGRVIQSTVQDYDIEETKRLLNGAPSFSSTFGDIKYYENDALLELCEHTLKIDKIHGVRAIASLCSNEQVADKDWLTDMLSIEWELLKNPSFVDIAYFKHLILSRA